MQGAFLVGKNMKCDKKIIKVEHPTANSCRYVGYCTKYKEYCAEQCKEKKKKNSQ